MTLTPQQIEELLQVLNKYLFTFLAHHVGTDILTDTQKLYLQTVGVSVQDIARTSYNVEAAYRFGILSDAIGDAAAKKMTYDQLKNYLSSGKSFALSPIEQSALQSLKYNTASEVLKLGEKIKSEIKNQLVHADLKRNTVKHSSIVMDAAKKAIEERKYVNEVVSEIGRRTGQWNKDLGRISDYVLHQAFDEGRAAAVVRNYGDDGLVYKDVYPGACNHCITAYLTGGIGSMPKLFKISQLKANGTNVGRKAQDWKPVVGGLHPWCRCTLNQAPEGLTLEKLQAGDWEWNGTVFRPVNKQVRRERPKVIVQIGNKIEKV